MELLLGYQNRTADSDSFCGILGGQIGYNQADSDLGDYWTSCRQADQEDSCRLYVESHRKRDHPLNACAIDWHQSGLDPLNLEAVALSLLAWH